MAPGDLPEPRVIASLKQGWTNIWPSFWVLLGMVLIAMVLEIPTSIGETIGGRTGSMLTSIGSAIALFVGVPLGMGITKAHLAVSRGEKAQFSDLGYAFSRRYLPALGLTLLTVIIVAIGFVLLIIPGIYLAIKLSMATYRFVDEDMGVIESLKASMEDTKGHWWAIFGMGLLTIPIIIAGALALGVGVFVSFVLISQMFAVYWRAITQ